MSSAVQPSSSAPVTASGSSQRQRGPVEEVIAKRMRQLGKKLQRYRTYASADPSTLNADQKASLNALPALEGAYKELEDLVRDKGPIEEQELIQAAKLREATESARSAALAESSSSSELFKTSLVKPLSLFLRLHSLLHPARSSDHEHLTFSALQLPSPIQDEVQATDVLRVGRMYEDLTLGGEAAQAVLEGLVKGPAGEDEENDHIHHLFALLDRPEPVVESALATPGEPHEDYTGAALAESAEEAVQAVPESAVEATELPNGHPKSHEPTSSGAINFLQEDELESGAQPVASEEDYEIVPQMEAHQTSGQQPPVEETPAPATQPARSFAPVSSVNWTDLDDEDTHGSTQPVPAAKVIEAEPTPESAVYTQETATVPETAVDTEVRAETPSTLAGSSSTPAKSPKGPRGGKTGRKPSQRPPRPQQGDRQPSQKGQQQGRQAQQPAAQQGGKVVDEDGFEQKVRRGSQAPTRGGGQTGRGMPRGNGSYRGRGGGRGGRGGANGVNGERGEKAGQGQATKAVPAKTSIYKDVQPTGPKSAPIS